MSEYKIFNRNSEHMSEIEDSTVDLIMTSPPYWNLKKYGGEDEIGQSSYDEYLKRLQNVWSECYRVAKPGAVMIININSRRHQKRFYPIPFDIALKMEKWTFWDQVIWYIPNALPQPNHYMERLLDNKFESCLVFIKGDADSYTCHKPRVPQKYASADPRSSKINPNGRCIGNILRIPAYRPPNVKEMGYHVAAYPEELAAFFIETYTDLNGTVLDPFLGSGTTMKVAKVMDRNCLGYELNKEFIPLIEKRINEEWKVPPWTNLDILHSASMETGAKEKRKSQYNNKASNDTLSHSNEMIPPTAVEKRKRGRPRKIVDNGSIELF
jgi:DNA modification methylase